MSAQSEWLRAHWDREILGGYDGQWITVDANNSVSDHDVDLRHLMERAAARGEADELIFAFVWFGAL